MTEPEQWAEDVWLRACSTEDPALTIQRAFEERMNNPGYLRGRFFSADPRSQALKETPDAG